MVTAQTAEIYEIEPSVDPEHETVVPYYEHAAALFEKAFGRAPSRNTLIKYIHQSAGYPVRKHGPYVKMPVFHRLKRVYTTKEAMWRFFQVVAELEDELGIHDADVTALEPMPVKRRPRRKAG